MFSTGMELGSLASRGCWALFEAMRKHSLSSEHFLALCIYIALGSSFRLSVANRSVDSDISVPERPKEFHLQLISTLLVLVEEVHCHDTSIVGQHDLAAFRLKAPSRIQLPNDDTANEQLRATAKSKNVIINHQIE